MRANVTVRCEVEGCNASYTFEFPGGANLLNAEDFLSYCVDWFVYYHRSNNLSTFKLCCSMHAPTFAADKPPKWKCLHCGCPLAKQLGELENHSRDCPNLPL